MFIFCSKEKEKKKVLIGLAHYVVRAPIQSPFDTYIIILKLTNNDKEKIII